jgi:diaminohydroxyphosphoribosylaminopyrimidine deaminase/5-amino-6-(5-phosphoribosylamino)uracil reductase
MNAVYMKRAIDLATLGTGFVNPDPLSGAVLVKEDRIIGEGFYQEYRGKSAIMEAINHAEGDLTGAELYVNIEPFGLEDQEDEVFHDIKAKGIQRVYIGMRDLDPDKKVDFIAELKKAGISCEVGLQSEECEELNEIYSYYIQHKLPFVIAKWAMTLDGKLATRTGDSKWISSEDSLHFVHQLRQRVAAIMVGENTVKLDNPLLTTRLEGVMLSNPLRVIVSKYGDLPMDAKVLQVDDNTKTLVITSENILKEKEEEIRQKGVQIVKLKERNHHIDFQDIMGVLGNMGIDSLYIEGGSSLLGSAFERGCIHKVYATVAPKIIGGKDAITPVGGIGIERMRDAIVLTKVSHEIIGPDVVMKGYINQENK